MSFSAIVLLLIINTKSLMGQPPNNNMPPKLITVIGSAEMSVEPDQVELTVTVYSDRGNFEKHENELMDICKKHGIPDSELAFKNQLGFNGWYHWYWWWYYRNSSAFYQTYKLKINSKLNFLDFVKDLNKTWIQNITISATTNKDIQVYRKEVKKEAIRMAKEKATYLLEAIDEKIGCVVSIEEVNADKIEKNYGGRTYPYYYLWDNPNYNNGTNNSTSNSSMSSNSSMNSGNVNTGNGNNENNGLDGLSKIKLRYEVKAVFEIK
jgi:hypothetical protein